MAKEPFLVEDAPKVISPIQLEALESLYKRKIDNAFYINLVSENGWCRSVHIQ